jgi:hypothetical protein
MQHHMARFSLRLRTDIDIDIPWFVHAWKDA